MGVVESKTTYGSRVQYLTHIRKNGTSQETSIYRKTFVNAQIV